MIPSEDELKAMESRANAATPGPWAPLMGEWSQVRAVGQEGFEPVIIAGDHDATDEDLVFVAAARTDVPVLIAAVRELQSEEGHQLVELKAAIRGCEADNERLRRDAGEREDCQKEFALGVMGDRERANRDIAKLQAENDRLRAEVREQGLLLVGQRAVCEKYIAENDRLRADAARLDKLERWLDDRCVALYGNPPQGLRRTRVWSVHLNGIGYQGWHATARDAIDAAAAETT